MGKPKITKSLKPAEKQMMVKLAKQSSPKFAHNAGAANKGVTWSYEFWDNAAPTNKGGFDLEMDIDKFKKMNENKQSETMNDDAIKFVAKEYPAYTVKLTSK